jgi:hypothetical protein
LEISASLKLNPVRLTKPALELIRSMVGREIRATVVAAGSGAGGLVQLRSGGTLIEARATGAPLRAGQQLFLKIEQPQPGSFRLVVLDPAGGNQSAGVAAQLSRALPPGPLQHLFGAFLRHYTRTVKSGRDGESLREAVAAATKTKASGTAGPRSGALASGGPIPAESAGRMLDAMTRLAVRVPELEGSALAQVLQSLQQTAGSEHAPDFWLGQGWGFGDDGEANSAAVAEDYIAVLGRLADSPYYFMSDFNLAAVGRISILVLSPDADFHRISLYLHPERLQTAQWLEAASTRLKDSVGAGVHWQHLEVVRPRDAAPESGGGLLDLQG